MGREEQVEEREVLDSIFPDEITGTIPAAHHHITPEIHATNAHTHETDISETEYRILVTLDIQDDEENDAPVMVLTVRYPEEYPDTAPHLDLVPADDGSTKHPLFNVADDKEHLLRGLEATIEENIGMAMVFTLVTTLKDEAEQLIAQRREEIARQKQELVLAAEREENKKFHGTPVTRDTFIKWREDFIKEMEEAAQREEEERLAELKKARIKEPTKLSGRQLWEGGLAKGGDDLEEDDDGPAEEMEKLKVSAV